MNSRQSAGGPLRRKHPGSVRRAVRKNVKFRAPRDDARFPGAQDEPGAEAGDPMTATREFKVEAEERGADLLSFLAQRLQTSRSKAKQLLDERLTRAIPDQFLRGLFSVFYTPIDSNVDFAICSLTGERTLLTLIDTLAKV